MRTGGKINEIRRAPAMRHSGTLPLVKAEPLPVATLPFPATYPTACRREFETIKWIISTSSLR
jgi:hypothetical protein